MEDRIFVGGAALRGFDRTPAAVADPQSSAKLKVLGAADGFGAVTGGGAEYAGVVGSGGDGSTPGAPWDGARASGDPPCSALWAPSAVTWVCGGGSSNVLESGLYSTPLGWGRGWCGRAAARAGGGSCAAWRGSGPERGVGVGAMMVTRFVFGSPSDFEALAPSASAAAASLDSGSGIEGPRRELTWHSVQSTSGSPG